MNVATITMDRDLAREKLREYRRGLHRRADAEWSAAATAYEALAEGWPVINLREAILAAPVDAQGRPRLAVARADRSQVHLVGGWASRHQLTFTTRLTAAQGRGLEVTILGANHDQPGGFALVPMVPPRQRAHRDLRKHFILWEVEAWADRRINAKPDRDPYLLQSLGGDLYAVVAEWDLTDVERMVMAGRGQ